MSRTSIELPISPPGERKPQRLKYVQAQPDEKGRAIACGELKHGLKIGNEVHRSFVMREALSEDLFRAEADVPPDKLLQFNAAIWAQTLVSLGTYKGPFTVGMLGQLKQRDYSTLRDAQLELDLLGEVE